MTEAVSFISVLADICTIIATVVAVVAFLIWKSQAKYSKKIDALLDFEDAFEVLLKNYMERHAWLLKQEEISRTVSDMSAADYWIKRNAAVANWKERILSVGFNYQMAFVRAKRLGLQVDKYDELDYTAIDQLFCEAINKLYAGDISSGMEVFAHSLSHHKNRAHAVFAALREAA